MSKPVYFALAACLSVSIPLTALGEPTDPPPLKKKTLVGEHPVIGFKSATHDFGKLAKGTKATHDFLFLNNGTADLIIDNVTTKTSGVTVSWSKTPVPPNEIGQIGLSLDTSILDGTQFIRLFLTSNAANGNSILYVKAEMVDDKLEEE